MFIPIGRWNLIIKRGGEWFFLLNQSVNVIYPNEGNEFMAPIMKKKKRLLCESMFVPIDRQTLILKMMEREAFFMKLKFQCQLSQWVERAYGTQSWKEKRLFCKSMFIQLTDKIWF